MLRLMLLCLLIMGCDSAEDEPPSIKGFWQGYVDVNGSLDSPDGTQITLSASYRLYIIVDSDGRPVTGASGFAPTLSYEYIRGGTSSGLIEPGTPTPDAFDLSGWYQFPTLRVDDSRYGLRGNYTVSDSELKADEPYQWFQVLRIENTSYSVPVSGPPLVLARVE